MVHALSPQGFCRGSTMSGEDMRHSFHTVEQVQAMVDSRVILPDGRIIEQDPDDPDENPPNAIRGNNADQ